MYICRGQGARGEGLNIHPTPSTLLAATIPTFCEFVPNEQKNSYSKVLIGGSKGGAREAPLDPISFIFMQF